MKELCIFGLGYIGLPTACLIAAHGYRLIGVDVNKEIVDAINQWKAPFEEPGLEELLQKALASNSQIAKVEAEAADVFIITAPTPLEKETKVADLRYVQQVTQDISSYLKGGDIVILASIST